MTEAAVNAFASAPHRMQNNYGDTYADIELLTRQMNGVLYEGVPLAGVIRGPFYMIRRARYLTKHRSRVLETLRLIAWATREFAKFLIPRQAVDTARHFAAPHHVVAYDNDATTFWDIESSVFGHLPAEDVLLLVQDANAHQRLAASGFNVVSTDDCRRATGPKMRHAKMIWRVLRRVPLLKRESLIFKLELATHLIRDLMGIDFYRRFITPATTRSVLTLCDALSNEHALTKVASARGIRTATLQHGLVDISVTPVSSDYVFVWGDVTRLEFLALGVPEEQIAVVGRPGLEAVLRQAAASRPAVRADFCRSHELPMDHPIVMYFATNWGPDENRGLFACFAACRDLPMTPVIKLKSNATTSDHQQYQTWLREYGFPDTVPIITSEPLWNCLTVADVLVTCHSSSAVEAMPFGTVSIVLDIYPHMELEATLPHYRDVITVRSSVELRETLSRLLDDKTYYESCREATLRSSRRFLANSPYGEASAVVAAYLRDGTRGWFRNDNRSVDQT